MTFDHKTGVSRRTLLKGGAAAGAAAAVSFPMPAIHAAEPITLRYLSTATNQAPAIAEQAFKDTGIKIEYVTVTTDDVTKRIVTQPDSFDLVDSEYFSLKNLVPSGNLMGMDAKKIKLFDKLATVITKGEVDGKKIGDQGTSPHKVLYLEKQRSKDFAKEPDRVDHPDPHDLQRRHARHPPRSRRQADRDLGRTARPGLQGEGVDPQHSVDRHHGCRDGRGIHRQAQICRQGQHDEG